MESDSPLFEAILGAVRQALVAAGDRVPLFLHILYSDSTSDVVTMPKQTSRPPNPTEAEEAILAVLRRAERPLKGSAIASRAGKRYTGHFRESLARLTADGTLLHDEDGYRLAPDARTH